MNILLINPVERYLIGFINYIKKNYTNMKIDRFVGVRFLKKRVYSKESIIVQIFLNLIYFFYSFIICRKKKFDYILLNGGLVAYPYLLLMKVFPFIKPKRDIIIMFFFLHKLADKRLIQQILKYLLDQERVILTVQSKYEKYFYLEVVKIRSAKIFYYPYCQDYIPTNEKYGKKRDYIFAGGHTNRDYACLFEAAKNIQYDFIVICSELNKIPIPSKRIEVLRNLKFEAFNGYLKNSKIVIIPLKDEVGSSGQMVALSAMSLKKPIIYADVGCISDYFIPNVSGIPYHRGNVADLTNKIEYLLSNPRKRTKLGNMAFKKFCKSFYITNYYKFYVELFLKNSKKIHRTNDFP